MVGWNARAITMNQPQRDDDHRWEILTSRQRDPEKPFFYAVITTGVVCRPGCPSRLPKRENVRFFDSCSAALQAGYRPCKRCHPLQDATPLSRLVEQTCRLIESDPDHSTLAQLAAKLGYSEAHLHKSFRRLTGISPHDYARTLRQQAIYRALHTSKSTTEAMMKSGYQTASTFYSEFRHFSSLPPGSHRAGGPDEVLAVAAVAASIGVLVVAASSRGVCWISLGDHAQNQVEELQQHFSKARFCEPDEEFNQWVQQVVAFVDQPSQALDLPLDIRGTIFQRQVWHALREVPPGTTLDYQSLAERIGKPGGARAVAQACAANVLAVAIPCHRIVRRDGSLSGYRWGVDRKATLLQREDGAKAKS